MKTIQKINRGFSAIATENPAFAQTPGSHLVDRMVEEFERPGRLEGKGFYSYAEDRTRLGLWPALIQHYHRPEVDLPFEDMTERLLVAAALEAARCYEKGIVRSIADANIGSIFGIGFPAWTGGTLQYIDQYEGGPAGFAARADELRAKYGDRFIVPENVRACAAAGELLSRS